MIKNIGSYMFQLFEDWGDIPEAEFEPGDDARYTGVYLALGEFEATPGWISSFATMIDLELSWSGYGHELLSYRVWCARRQRAWRAAEAT